MTGVNAQCFVGMGLTIKQALWIIQCPIQQVWKCWYPLKQLVQAWRVWLAALAFRQNQTTHFSKAFAIWAKSPAACSYSFKDCLRKKWTVNPAGIDTCREIRWRSTAEHLLGRHKHYLILLSKPFTISPFQVMNTARERSFWCCSSS